MQIRTLGSQVQDRQTALEYTATMDSGQLERRPNLHHLSAEKASALTSRGQDWHYRQEAAGLRYSIG